MGWAEVLPPFVPKLGLGRLPGDIVVSRGSTTFHFPIVTSLILSLAFTEMSWLMGR